MRVTRLEVDGLRNLRDVAIEPHPALNLLTGRNGAGKSSVLEALQCLSTGHSFRTRRTRELLARDRDVMTVAGRLHDPRDGREHRIGLARQRDGLLEMRVDFESVDSAAVATRLLPVKALTPDSHALLQEGPDERRRFLDWGVFHVEPRFFEAWRRFRRALAQRNQALRDGRAEAEVRSWDEQLAVSGTEVDRFRRAYVDALEEALASRTARLASPLEVSLRYRSGWSDELSLAEVLARNIDAHRRLKTTSDGPHRGEIVVTQDGVPARVSLSRGQQKLLVYLLHLSQLDRLLAVEGRRAVVLCDDLGAELDPDAMADVTTQLAETAGQLFITGVDVEPFRSRDHVLFHVERGRVGASTPEAGQNAVSSG